MGEHEKVGGCLGSFARLRYTVLADLEWLEIAQLSHAGAAAVKHPEYVAVYHLFDDGGHQVSDRGSVGDQ